MAPHSIATAHTHRRGTPLLYARGSSLPDLFAIDRSRSSIPRVDVILHLVENALRVRCIVTGRIIIAKPFVQNVLKKSYSRIIGALLLTFITRVGVASNLMDE
jgi:hypothetical protein